MADTFAQFSKKLAAIEKDLTDKRSNVAYGKAAVTDVAEAVRGDIGDMSMSRWRPGSPIQIVARFDDVVDGVEVAPVKRARGPMRVLEQGRQAGTKGDKLATGKFTKKGNARYRKVKRTSAGTAGKGTWSDAVKLMEKRHPERVHAELVKVLTKRL